MKKMLGLLLYGLALFGITAGVGFFLRPHASTEHPEDAAADVHASVEHPESGEVDPGHLDIDHSGAIHHEDPGHGQHTAADPLPVAIRPEEMSIEQIVRLGLGLNEREATIREKERSLQKTEMRYQLVMADMQGERKELEGLYVQARDQRLAAEELLKQISEKKATLDALQLEVNNEKKDLEAGRLKLEQERAKGTTPAAEPQTAPTGGSGSQTDADLQAQVKIMAPLLEGMSPEKVAEQLQEMVNNGNMELAVAVVTIMEKRKASAALDSLTTLDKKLVNDILGQVGARQAAPRVGQKKR